jgi:protein SCO1/2
MMKKRVISFLLLSLLAGGALAGPQLKAGVFEPALAAPELALPATTGKPFSLADYRGKVVLLAFGYTRCQAVCPVTLAMLAQAQQLLGADAAQAQVVFVSVDPGRDSVQQLAAYLKGYDPRFVGASGSAQQLAPVMQAWGVSAERHPFGTGGDYVIAHSSSIYFIDRKGRLRALLPFGRPAADVAHDVRALLGERS